MRMAVVVFASFSGLLLHTAALLCVYPLATSLFSLDQPSLPLPPTYLPTYLPLLQRPPSRLPSLMPDVNVTQRLEAGEFAPRPGQ